MGVWVYLDYSVNSGPFLRYSMRFEILSEISDHSVCETSDPSLTINSNGGLVSSFKHRTNITNSSISATYDL